MFLFILSFILLIGMRCIFNICMRVSDSKAYMRNRDRNFFDKWFFVSMHKEIRDRYVKVEKRIVHFHTSAMVYFIINAVLHIAFALIVLSEIITLFWMPLKDWMIEMYTIYYGLLCLAFVVLGGISQSENRTFYKNLNRKRKK